MNLPDIALIFGYATLSFLMSFALAKPFIAFLFKNRIGKQIRIDATGGGKATLFHALHLKKQGTPTMGGLLILATVFCMVALSRILSYFGIIDRSLMNRKETYLVLVTLAVCAALGALDDWLNINNNKNKGLKTKPKFWVLTAIALVGAWWFHFKLGIDTIHIPYFGDFYINGWYIPLFIFIFIASAHSVNITDGLDGLAAGLLIIAFIAFGVIAYFKGLYLLTTLIGVLVGALTSFLWYNIPPAQFFMGDVGSLSLGATLGVIALMTDSVAVLPIIGFIFVIETISVIIQQLSKKFRNGKKVFHIAPIHHHFEQIGWPESKVVMRFWIVGGAFGIVGLILAML
jgi:phospho-N-acetylmuramoyl-pentapeptide-transferase